MFAAAWDEVVSKDVTGPHHALSTRLSLAHVHVCVCVAIKMSTFYSLLRSPSPLMRCEWFIADLNVLQAQAQMPYGCESVHRRH